MSIIFGLLKEAGSLAKESEVEQLGEATARYGTGIGSSYRRGRLGMGVQPYFSHERSAMEAGPTKNLKHCVLSFDGRLDNYTELAELLGLKSHDVSDSQIVLTAFEQWGEACFSRLVGDWALALWSEKQQSLYLARDHAGTRTLYFQNKEHRLVWSTFLDSFQRRDVKLPLCKDYAARYLACRHIGDLTPYEGILSVTPAHYLIIRSNIVGRHAHWMPVRRSVTRYSSDEEYEAHFLALFKRSVERRTGPGAPILAQLSGGMDSTAIVCMSDHLRCQSGPNSEILDTISFYDESEASLNERPYFSLVEARRGKVGTHLNTAFSQRTFEVHDAKNGKYVLPGADSFSFQQECQLWETVWQRGNRSILSGIGGDEVLGGVPDPSPELADYLVSGSFRKLLRQGVAWSLADRSPLIGTLNATAGYVVGLYGDTRTCDSPAPPWISNELCDRLKERGKRQPAALCQFGIEPHRLESGRTWWSIMETLPHLFPNLLFRIEYRYPFLDRDLVEFLFSIPREQILRPGRRRSLMRRALVNIVPREILERRRKAFQLRAPLSALQQAYPRLLELFADSAIANEGLVDLDKLRFSLGKIAEGSPEWRQAMQRAIALELWIKGGLHENQQLLPNLDDSKLALNLTT
jgi:asparagine synthase (glutamine-hydrolysing)